MTIVDDMEALRADLKAAGEHNERQAATITALQADIAARDALVAEKVALFEAAVAEREKVAADSKAAIDAAGAQIEALLGELVAAKAALANPAFADAARGGGAPVAEGAAVAQAMTRDEAIAAYRGIVDPVERARFREAHKKELGIVK